VPGVLLGLPNPGAPGDEGREGLGLGLGLSFAKVGFVFFEKGSTRTGLL
jgi:hypothetical protein